MQHGTATVLGQPKHLLSTVSLPCLLLHIGYRLACLLPSFLPFSPPFLPFTLFLSQGLSCFCSSYSRLPVPTSFRLILLSLPPISLQECWDYRWHVISLCEFLGHQASEAEMFFPSSFCFALFCFETVSLCGLLCGPGWPQTYKDSPASTSLLL